MVIKNCKSFISFQEFSDKGKKTINNAEMVSKVKKIIQ